MTSLVHVSLFSGIGGFDVAFERAGIPTVAACEIDNAARGVLADHWPHLTLLTDVREVTTDVLTAAGAHPRRTVLTAGWPCQGNSVAGRRGGMGDERSGLWSEVARILAEHRPAWFIGENVPGLLSVAGGWDYATVIGDMARLGYGFAWRILDARHFGVPQRRRRIVLVGHLGDDGRAPAQVLLEPEGGGRHPAQSITPRPIFARRTGGGTGGRVAKTVLASRGQRFDPETDELIVGVTGTTSHALTAEGADPGDAGKDSLILSAVAAGATVRRLTPLECERLQGYPDHWTATSNGKPQSDSQRYKQLGNSIAVPVFAWVAKRLVAVDQAIAEQAAA